MEVLEATQRLKEAASVCEDYHDKDARWAGYKRVTIENPLPDIVSPNRFYYRKICKIKDILPKKLSCWCFNCWKIY